jgi:hypothetical protein
VLTAALLAGRIRQLLGALGARLGPAGLDVLSITLLTAAACVVYLPLSLGIPPTSADNNAHLLKIVELESLLASGRLFGWTDAELAGYPYGLQYPVAGYLITAVLRRVSGASLEAAYAWTVLLLGVLASVLAVYAAARLHLSRAAAILAGLFALLDPGGKIVGGWFWAVASGVWPSSAASACFLVALALLPGALATGGLRALAAPGSLVGVGMLFHPVVIVLGLYACVPMAVALLSSERTVPPAVLLARTAAVGGVALAVSAFWLVPMLAARPYTIDFVYAPPSSNTLWTSLVDGTALQQPPLWLGVSLCGLLMIARRRDPFSRFIILFVPLALVLSTVEGLSLVGLYTGGRRTVVDFLQVKRVHLLVRPLCFIAAGHALASLVEAIASRRRAPRDWRARLPAAYLGALGALAVALPGVHVPGWPERPAPSDMPEEERAVLTALLEELRPLVGPGERVALYAQGHHFLLGPAALHGFKVLKLGFTPATLFKNRPAQDAEALGRVGATVLITWGPTPEPLAHLDLIGSVESFEVREIPKLPRAWIEEGPGTARVLSWEDELIRVEVEGAEPPSRLRLMLGYHEGWRERSGLPVSAIDRLGTGMTTLPARDGEIVLEYRRVASQWVGLGASALGMGSLVALLARRRAAA